MVNKDEFAAAFEECADAMFAHCYFRLSNRERSLELVQDTFMKTWDYIQKSGVIKNMRAFLYTTLNRLIIDEYRKKKSSSLDEILESETVSQTVIEKLSMDSREETENKLDTKASVRYLHRSLKKLSEKDANLVMLRYIDRLSAREVAKVLGMKAAAVNVAGHRALRKLKVIMRKKIS